MTSKNINSFIFWPLLVFVLFLQLTLIPQLFSNSITPNFLFILLIAASFLDKTTGMLYVSFFCAFVLDIFSDIYFGPLLISFFSGVFISSYLKNYFLKELFSLNLFLISFLGVIVYNVLYFILINLSDFERILNNGDLTNLSRLGFVIAFEIIYAAILICPFVFFLKISIFNFKDSAKI